MRFRTVATGGTFDHLHDGHRALLKKSFESGDRVVIGVTSDEFARKQGKRPQLAYAERVRRLRGYIRATYPGREFTIAKLDDFFGPGIASSELEAIVVSHETAPRVTMANSLRAAKGFAPLKVVMVRTIMAEDGLPISSTRIRAGDIDQHGKKSGARPPKIH